MDEGSSSLATNGDLRNRTYHTSTVGGFSGEKFENYTEDARVECHCREVCKIVSSWTTANPSRRFYGCRNYGVCAQLECDLFGLIPFF